MVYVTTYLAGAISVVLIGLVFAWSAASLRDQSSRTVRIETSSVFVDDYDISAIFSEQELTLLITFITAAHTTLTCAMLHRLLAGTEQPDHDPCQECMKHDWSPSKCAHYRNIKNRITATRKVLELLRLGTIAPATGNPRKIREAGWLVRLEPGVLVDDVRASV